MWLDGTLHLVEFCILRQTMVVICIPKSHREYIIIFPIHSHFHSHIHFLPVVYIISKMDQKRFCHYMRHVYLKPRKISFQYSEHLWENLIFVQKMLTTFFDELKLKHRQTLGNLILFISTPFILIYFTFDAHEHTSISHFFFVFRSLSMFWCLSLAQMSDCSPSSIWNFTWMHFIVSTTWMDSFFFLIN